MTGRIRTVKPEWLEDQLLASLSDEARVLSVALIVMSDDYGVGRGSLADLATAWKHQISKHPEKASEYLARASRASRELVEMRFLRFFDVAGQTYFFIRNWSRHQKVDKPAKRRLPEPPPEDSATAALTSEPVPAVSRDSRETPAPVSPNPRERSGPPTSDLRPPTGTENLRNTLASAWRVGYVRRLERACTPGLTHSGPQGGDMAKLIDEAASQPDPLVFVERALDGFFGTPRMASMRPAFPVRFLAEDAVGFAACSTRPAGTSDARNVELTAGIPRLEVQ